MPLMRPITQHTAYIPGANNLGFIITADRGAIVIDTGMDKDTGRSIRKALDEAGLSLCAIINTHHHADHIGGNAFLQHVFPHVPTLAPKLEAALIMNPILEPVYLHYGAAPHTALQTKWLMAKPSRVDTLIEGPQLQIAGIELELIQLAGHSLQQIGIVYDGVCFVADGFFGPAVVAKHGIPYAQDVTGQRRTLEYLRTRQEQYFLPGHGELTQRAALDQALDANLTAINTAADTVYAALESPADLSSIAARVRQMLQLSMSGVPQYAIYLSLIAAHLTALEQEDRAYPELEDTGIIWHRK